MKKGGYVFLVFLLLFLSVPAYGVKFLSCFVCSTVLIAFFSSKFNARGLTVERKDRVIRVYKGHTIRIELEICNYSRLSQEYLFVTDDHGPLYGGKGSNKMIALKPYEKTRMSYTLECRDRGLFTVGPLTVRGADVFGFFPWTKKTEETTDVIVYPSLHSVDGDIGDGLMVGNLGSVNPLYEDLTMYRSIREYARGDDPRRIHWKVSARMGDLYTREYMPTFYYSALIVLNVSRAHYSVRRRESRIERSIEAAAALALYCLQQGQNTGFLSNGRRHNEEALAYVPVGGGYSHTVQILENLARLEACDHDWRSLLQESVELPFGTRILYVGPPVSDSLYNLFVSRWGSSRCMDFYYVDREDMFETGVISAQGRHRRFLIRDYGGDMIDG